jgi:hypothetical protein
MLGQEVMTYNNQEGIRSISQRHNTTEGTPTRPVERGKVSSRLHARSWSLCEEQVIFVKIRLEASALGSKHAEDRSVESYTACVLLLAEVAICNPSSLYADGNAFHAAWPMFVYSLFMPVVILVNAHLAHFVKTRQITIPPSDQRSYPLPRPTDVPRP